MYELKVLSHFAAAHQLRESGGKCENLHGHNWKIEACVTSKALDNHGLVVDFQVIKKALAKVLDGLDHQFLNDLACFQDDNPSSESIARFIFQALQEELNRETVKVSKVTAWESDTACASYMES